jgi:tRNA A37 threonylcarbamoyladenosine dehydratase
VSDPTPAAPAVLPADGAPQPPPAPEAAATGSPEVGAEEDRYRLHRRFDRMGRLVGDDAMARLFGAHVVVIGLGGVGSWAAEALARSGVGRLTLVDYDVVCITNSNRQLQAVRGAVGKAKASVLAERLRAINPQLQVRAVPLFYEARIADSVLKGADHVVDAIDNLTAKAHLVATCRERGIPIVVSTGAAGRIDPTRVQICDLARTRVDGLAHALRKVLRQQYAFPRTGDFGIPAVYSEEPLQQPHELRYDHGEGFRCVCPPSPVEIDACTHQHVIWGTAGFVTGAFGLAAASAVVRRLLPPA